MIEKTSNDNIETKTNLVKKMEKKMTIEKKYESKYSKTIYIIDYQ